MRTKVSWNLQMIQVLPNWIWKLSMEQIGQRFNFIGSQRVNRQVRVSKVAVRSMLAEYTDDLLNAKCTSFFQDAQCAAWLKATGYRLDRCSGSNLCNSPPLVYKQVTVLIPSYILVYCLWEPLLWNIKPVWRYHMPHKCSIVTPWVEHVIQKLISDIY